MSLALESYRTPFCAVSSTRPETAPTCTVDPCRSAHSCSGCVGTTSSTGGRCHWCVDLALCRPPNAGGTCSAVSSSNACTDGMSQWRLVILRRRGRWTVGVDCSFPAPLFQSREQPASPAPTASNAPNATTTWHAAGPLPSKGVLPPSVLRARKFFPYVIARGSARAVLLVAARSLVVLTHRAAHMPFLLPRAPQLWRLPHHRPRCVHLVLVVAKVHGSQGLYRPQSDRTVSLVGLGINPCLPG